MYAFLQLVLQLVALQKSSSRETLHPTLLKLFEQYAEYVKKFDIVKHGFSLSLTESDPEVVRSEPEMENIHFATNYLIDSLVRSGAKILESTDPKAQALLSQLLNSVVAGDALLHRPVQVCRLNAINSMEFKHPGFHSMGTDVFFEDRSAPFVMVTVKFRDGFMAQHPILLPALPAKESFTLGALIELYASYSDVLHQSIQGSQSWPELSSERKLEAAFARMKSLVDDAIFAMPEDQRAYLAKHWDSLRPTFVTEAEAA